MTHTWTVDPAPQQTSDKRANERRAMALPARLTWKDQRGATRFASAVTRDVSEFGVFVECQPGVSIPLYRLVQFQLEREAKDAPLPQGLRQGRVLSAVYRVTSPAAGTGRSGYALRLMVEPRRAAAETPAATRRATA